LKADVGRRLERRATGLGRSLGESRNENAEDDDRRRHEADGVCHGPSIARVKGLTATNVPISRPGGKTQNSPTKAPRGDGPFAAQQRTPCQSGELFSTRFKGPARGPGEPVRLLTAFVIRSPLGFGIKGTTAPRWCRMTCRIIRDDELDLWFCGQKRHKSSQWWITRRGSACCSLVTPVSVTFVPSRFRTRSFVISPRCASPSSVTFVRES